MLAGQEAMSGLLAIANASDADFRKLSDAISNSAGAAEEMAAIKLDNLAGDVKYLQSAFGTLQITISDTLKGSLREFVQFGTKAITAMTEGFQGNGILGLMDTLSGIITDAITMLIQKAPQFVEVGLKFVESIANGILNARFKVWETLNNLVTTMRDGISSYIEVHAAEMKELGIAVIQLIAKGFSSAGEVISKHIGEFIPLIANAFLTYHRLLFDVGVDIITAIGSGIVENRYELQNMATRTVQNIVTAIKENAPMIIEGGLALMEILANAVIDNLPLIVEVGSEIINRLALGISEASPAVQMIIGTLIFPKLLKIISVVTQIGGAVTTVISGITTGLQSLFTVMMTNPTTAVIAGIVALVAAFVMLWNNCEGFRNFFINMWDGIKSAVSNVGDFIVNVFQERWENVKRIWNNATGFFQSLWENITGIFSRAFDKFKNIGGEMIAGIWQGITEAVSWLYEQISDFFGGIIDGVKGLLGIHSPSRVFAGIGENMAAGLGEGWDSEFDRIRRQIEDGMDFGTASIGVEARGNYGLQGSSYGVQGGAANANQPQDIVINLTMELDGAVLARKMVRYNARAESLVGPSLVVASRQ